MAAVPAPDGRPARPRWQAAAYGGAYLAVWVLIGLGVYMLLERASTA